MIVAEPKPIKEVVEMVKDCSRVLVIGCKGCVTVCNVGGSKEVGILASALRIAAAKAGRRIEVGEHTLERQCDPEYIEEVKDRIEGYDGVVSIACGVGPQFLSERYPEKRIFPGVNTRFMGGAVQHGIWEERCAGCGTCVIHFFGGMCPIARCSKSLMNGPCGGSARGKCEIAKDVDCVWDLIVRKLMAQGRLEDLLQFRPPKSWTTARDGGPRKLFREELVK
ncbi:methylenetetrahydrofolate reductase C-terminal domain-containing protein [Desulfatiglans anilini]|uniref:methylenetetrahydrofolate reductase C-terminal domain-containing protein n=1 Tax=Desulfatiglans anilini TaxID=90728 RepID=UPI0004066612|nr:methylenetetrahydrofolate reductase C-terminal domain-containing protein [Desulfatiglans anilini]